MSPKLPGKERNPSYNQRLAPDRRTTYGTLVPSDGLNMSAEDAADYNLEPAEDGVIKGTTDIIWPKKEPNKNDKPLPSC